MTQKKLRLSICVVTYNHEKYIAQALDSFLMQETDFAFQVIVGDDCSTDNTVKILKEYAQKYPDIIKPIIREKNIGAINNSLDVYDHAKTEYVAICDGDDYWTDSKKLQKQVDFLDRNLNFSICFHPVRVIHEDKTKEDLIYPDLKHRLFWWKRNSKNLLRENFIQTNSIVYRWKFSKYNIKDFMPNNIAPGDWYLMLLHAKQGKVGFINEVMSVYNKHIGGIWGDAYSNMDNLHLKYGLEELNFYYNVYKNISDSNPHYYKRMLKFFIKLFCLYVKNKKFDKVEILFNEYKKEFDMMEKLLKKSHRYL